MARILLGIKQFFDDDKWTYVANYERSILTARYAGDGGSWRVVARAREVEQQLVVYSVLDVPCPEERRSAMAEFITRANYGMIMGNFEMDYSDGEVRYKTSIDFEGMEITFQACRQLVYPNMMTMNRYYSSILAVAFGGVDPKSAVEDAEA